MARTSGHSTSSRSSTTGRKRRATSKKAPSSRRYGKGASAKVAKVMHEKKEGTLRSGRSGKKVTSRKQAIAIGLSEARRKGEKVPARSS